MRACKTICFLTILGALHFAYPALAQTSDQTTLPPAAAAPSTPAPELLKPAELEGLVAPIALYPDTLLANVLMAATYPLRSCGPSDG
jgi:Protein of unknown function (DUF3300)